MSRLPRPVIEWTDLSTECPDVILTKLNHLVRSSTELKNAGYILEPLTEQDLWSKQRCSRCTKPLKHWAPHRPEVVKMNKDGPVSACVYHDTRLLRGRWECCDGHMFETGCCKALLHTPCNIDFIRQDWQMISTPVTSSQSSTNPKPSLIKSIVSPYRYDNFKYSDESNASVTGSIAPGLFVRDTDIRAAVALDCEMGVSKIGTSVLIRLSVVDFLTQEVLIDNYVEPDIDLAHCSTKWSGVTFADIRKARMNGTAIQGVEKAQEKLYRFVDSTTIIVVHGGVSDMTVLRTCHPADKIVDTLILENSDPAVVQGMKKSLKDICRRRCGITIQDARLSTGKKAGHDSVEDAMAAREIVCSWLQEGQRHTNVVEVPTVQFMSLSF